MDKLMYRDADTPPVEAALDERSRLASRTATIGTIGAIGATGATGGKPSPRGSRGKTRPKGADATGSVRQDGPPNASG